MTIIAPATIAAATASTPTATMAASPRLPKPPNTSLAEIMQRLGAPPQQAARRDPRRAQRGRAAPELARALEERGFESVWAPEHSHIPLSRKTPFPGGGDLPKPYYDAMDPFVVLAAAAQATHQTRQTGVALIQQRDAIQTAKLVASINQVSQGRFLFGVGGGWNQDEMEDHGTV
jgi:probable F420-dependent oxidoreductase